MIVHHRLMRQYVCMHTWRLLHKNCKRVNREPGEDNNGTTKNAEDARVTNVSLLLRKIDNRLRNRGEEAVRGRDIYGHFRALPFSEASSIFEIEMSYLFLPNFLKWVITRYDGLRNRCCPGKRRPCSRRHANIAGATSSSPMLRYSRRVPASRQADFSRVPIGDVSQSCEAKSWRVGLLYERRIRIAGYGERNFSLLSIADSFVFLSLHFFLS